MATNRYHVCSGPCAGHDRCICCIKHEGFIEATNQKTATRKVLAAQRGR